MYFENKCSKFRSNDFMPDLAKLSYLIVDDVTSIREFLRQSLFQLGANEVHEASNGIKALEAYNTFLPDIVFLDIELPDMNGNDILKQMKARKHDSFIVMVSAHNSVDNVKKSISNGASGFIVKPFSPQKISTVLNKFTG